MSETHINTYAMEVQEKKHDLEVAKGALASAEAALQSHPDYVAPEPSEAKKKPSAKK